MEEDEGGEGQLALLEVTFLPFLYSPVRLPRFVYRLFRSPFSLPYVVAVDLHSFLRI